VASGAFLPNALALTCTCTSLSKLAEIHSACSDAPLESRLSSLATDCTVQGAGSVEETSMQQRTTHSLRILNSPSAVYTSVFNEDTVSHLTS
jgi:hypothetical protein